MKHSKVWRAAQSSATLCLLTAALLPSLQSTAAAASHVGGSIIVAPADYITPFAVKQFIKDTGIKTTADNIEFDPLQAKIAAASEAHTYFADVADVDWSETAFYAHTKWFLPLNKYFNVKQLKADDPQISSFMYHGELIALPEDLSTTITTVNVVDFHKAGITKMPTTLTQYYNDLMAIKNKGVLKYPLAAPLGAGEPLTDTWDQLAAGFGNDGQVISPAGKPLFTSTSSPGYKAAAFLLKAYDNGLIAPGDINDSFEQNQSAIEHNQVASIYADFGGAISLYNEPSNSTVVGDIAYLQCPGNTGPTKLLADPDGLGIPATAKNVAGAVEFIKWMNNPRNEAAFQGVYGQNWLQPGQPPPNNVAGINLVLKSPVSQHNDLRPLINWIEHDSVPTYAHNGPAWVYSWSLKAADALHSVFATHEPLKTALSQLASETNAMAAANG